MRGVEQRVLAFWDDLARQSVETTMAQIVADSLVDLRT